MDIKVFDTSPNGTDVFWQVVFLPTVTLLRNREFNTSYTVVSFEWLFWSITIIINDN